MFSLLCSLGTVIAIAAGRAGIRAHCRALFPAANLGLAAPCDDGVIGKDKDGPRYPTEHRTEDEPLDPKLQ